MYTQYPPPPDFHSNGCTAPDVFRSLYGKYKEACTWHDWARRHLVHYGVATVEQADNSFREYMIALGAWRWFARITWVVVKLTRTKYHMTSPVPTRWMPYLVPTSSI